MDNSGLQNNPQSTSTPNGQNASRQQATGVATNVADLREQLVSVFAENLRTEPQPQVYLVLAELRDKGLSQEQIDEIVETLNNAVIDKMLIEMAKAIPPEKVKSMLEIGEQLDFLQSMELYRKVYKKETSRDFDEDFKLVVEAVWGAYLKDIRAAKEGAKTKTDNN